MNLIIAWARWKVRAFHWLMLYLPSELAHRIFVWSTQLPILGNGVLWLFRLARRNIPKQPQWIGPLRLDNPVGIAAGFDKNAQCISALDALGFGFIEVGTVTPRPQSGNAPPRIKKLFAHQALVNAMGFNNDGIAKIQHRLASLPVHLKQKVMVSISKNKDSVDWLLDLQTCMAAVWFDCAAICVNISSPNTPGLRNLQGPDQIIQIAKLYQALCQRLGPSHLHPTTHAHLRFPLLACKLSPDMDDSDFTACLNALLKNNFGAVILTNTTQDHPYMVGQFKGGLSGAPLTQKSNRCLQIAHETLKNQLPIIAVGGIMTVDDAQEKFRLGATAIQIYTGFIFKGPKLLWDLQDLRGWSLKLDGRA